MIKSARKTDITEKQGEAIVLLISASVQVDAKKSKAALGRVGHYATIWADALRLNLQPVVEEEQLLAMAQFFGNGIVSRVSFKSPGTNISYAPYDYITVGQLILNRDVTVLFSRTGGLSGFADTLGSYFHESNFFMIYNMDPRSWVLNFVHEATHIIQDWQDVSALAHYNEADAFIAAAAAELGRYPDGYDTDDVSVKALAAGRMVLDKKAVPSNKHWVTAYNEVVMAVGRLYKKYGIRVDHVKAGEGTSEKTKYENILRWVTAANRARDVALDRAAEILKQVIP